MGWVLAFALSLVSVTARSAPASCYAAWGYGTDTLTPSAVRLLHEAEVVVVADAEDSLPRLSGATDLLSGRRVRFRVRSVLRGEHVPPDLALPGFLVKDDDFHEGPVPFDNARLAAMGGSCFAFEYRRGARYLFLLKRASVASVVADAGTLTPYWAPLRPTNEQLRADDDRWLIWVRSHLN